MEKDELIKAISNELKLQQCRNRKIDPDTNSRGSVMHLLAVAADHGIEVTSTELCKKLGVTTPRVTLVLNGLEEKGLIERVCAENDHRRKIIILTEAGKKHVAEHRARRAKGTADLVERIGLKDAEAFLRILKVQNEMAEEFRHKQ